MMSCWVFPRQRPGIGAKRASRVHRKEQVSARLRTPSLPSLSPSLQRGPSVRVLHRRGRLHPADPVARVRGQQAHAVQLVQRHRQPGELDGAKQRPRARHVRARIRVRLEDLTARRYGLDGLEQAVTHDHHGEDLHAAPRHVHHEPGHPDRLQLRHRELVRLLLARRGSQRAAGRDDAALGRVRLALRGGTDVPELSQRRVPRWIHRRVVPGRARVGEI
mmetsp:Transcript_2771/g.11313  ORF Transcript_2771/g.11313 Transcript_2771/m.11313 type:complete len:219 (-) Transcript_2771:261-917(-)